MTTDNAFLGDEVMVDSPEKRLMLSVVTRAIQDAVLPDVGASKADVRDAHDFLSRPERCGEYLQWLGIDAEAFSARYRRSGADAYVYLVCGPQSTEQQRNSVRRKLVFRRDAVGAMR